MPSEAILLGRYRPYLPLPTAARNPSCGVCQLLWVGFGQVLPWCVCAWRCAGPGRAAAVVVLWACHALTCECGSAVGPLQAVWAAAGKEIQPPAAARCT